MAWLALAPFGGPISVCHDHLRMFDELKQNNEAFCNGEKCGGRKTATI